MRLASRVLPIKRALHSQQCACNRHHPPTRSFSISSTITNLSLLLSQPENNSNGQNQGRGSPKHSQTRSSPVLSSLIQKRSEYSKWRHLLINSRMLARESDFFRTESAKHWFKRLLVDQPENDGDFELWSCLLEYRMRIHGTDGVKHVLKGLWGRKSLHDVHHPLAQTFWRLILQTAVRSGDESMLNDIWVYSEWMYHVHNVRWPDLYSTVMAHWLQTHQHQRAIQWHVRLAQNFHPGPHELADLIKRFAHDRELHRAGTLLAVYFANPYHGLYDIIVPYLFNLGLSRMANEWRLMCIRLGDGPSSPIIARPFIRYLLSYLPDENFTPEELAAAEVVGEPRREDVADFSREMVNRVQGRVFGIKVKKYNDNMGAKWFATTWVSLETAMSTVVALGIEKIGPLSLQSIALRERTPQGVLRRLDQLQQNGISVVDSNYFQTMIHIATLYDDELLVDLLETDLHPDVFDDIDLQTRLASSLTKPSDWRTLRLVLVSRVIAVERVARDMANTILRSSFMRGDLRGVIKILQDMQLRQLPVKREEVEFICDSFFEGTGTIDLQKSRFYLAIFRQLASMDIPVSLNHWRMLLLLLLREGWLDDFEKLSIYLMDLFIRNTSARPGFMPVHIDDVPKTMATPFAHADNLLGIYIPQDLSPNNSKHPVRQLFNKKLLREMMIVPFKTTPGHGLRTVQEATTTWKRNHSQASQIYEHFRVLRSLYDRGLYLDHPVVGRVIAAFFNIFFSPTPLTYQADIETMASNTLTLPQMKTLIDEAWASGDDNIELLPSVSELEEYALNAYDCPRPDLTLNFGRRSADKAHLPHVSTPSMLAS